MLAWTIVAAFSLELPDGLVKATIPAVLLARARSLLLAKGVGKSCLGSIAQKSGAHDVCVCRGASSANTFPNQPLLALCKNSALTSP